MNLGIFYFPLRWKTGVCHGESLVIFGPLAKINTDLSASDEEYSDEEEDNDSEVTEDSHEPLQRGLAQYLKSPTMVYPTIALAATPCDITTNTTHFYRITS